MGHDIHFLERLDRVADGHVERALTLYRDGELLREVLSRADLPASAERLAISLDDPVEGPFVIVTRSGRFVTCLGRGMRVSKQALPVLTRAQLDVAASSVERMRESLARVSALRESGRMGRAAQALERLHLQGMRFSREDAAVLLEVQPLLHGDTLARMQILARSIAGTMLRVAHLRWDRLTPIETELVLAFGRSTWAFGHLLVLGARDERPADEDDPYWRWRTSTSTLGTMLGTLHHTNRAIWALTQRPKQTWRALRRFDDESGLASTVRVLATGAIAAGRSSVRAEAEKALPRTLAIGRGDRLRSEEVRHLGVDLRTHLAARARVEAYQLEVGRHYAARLLHGRSEVDEAERAAIPESIAHASLAYAPQRWIGAENVHGIRPLIRCVPWLARAEPEELFLPAAYASAFPEVSVDSTRELVESFSIPSRRARQAPLRTRPRIGRNQRCPCESGGKFKRCCLRAAA